jgi:hypothetical protein
MKYVNLGSVLINEKAFYRPIILISIPSVLSIFVHLWHSIGFPRVHYGEAIYTGKGMRIPDGPDPREPVCCYKYPFLGQIFFGSIFAIIEYPEFVHPSLIMGLFSVIDDYDAKNYPYSNMMFNHPDPNIEVRSRFR